MHSERIKYIYKIYYIFYNIMNNLGVFLNNTDSELKVSINLHNYNILKSNFNSVIINDIDNNFSQKLKNIININNFSFNNRFY